MPASLRFSSFFLFLFIFICCWCLCYPPFIYYVNVRAPYYCDYDYEGLFVFLCKMPSGGYSAVFDLRGERLLLMIDVGFSYEISLHHFSLCKMDEICITISNRIEIELEICFIPYNISLAAPVCKEYFFFVFELRILLCIYTILPVDFVEITVAVWNISQI